MMESAPPVVVKYEYPGICHAGPPENPDGSDSVTLQMSSTELIEEHLHQIRNKIDAHTMASEVYARRERYIGYPTSVLSGFLASALLMEFDSEGSQWVKIATVAMSVIMFFLSTTQNYLGYGKLCQSHDTSSKLYTTLLRGVELRLVAKKIKADEKRDIFKDILEQMSIIEQFESPLPAWITACSSRTQYMSAGLAVTRALGEEEAPSPWRTIPGRPSISASPRIDPIMPVRRAKCPSPMRYPPGKSERSPRRDHLRTHSDAAS